METNYWLDWKDIFGDDQEKANTIAVEVNRRKKCTKIKNTIGSPAPGYCQSIPSTK